jgi:hypothetical protein
VRGVLENEHTPLLENEHSECLKTSIPKIFHLFLLYYRDYRERKPEKLSLSGAKKGEKHETCDD